MACVKCNNCEHKEDCKYAEETSKLYKEIDDKKEPQVNLFDLDWDDMDDLFF